MSTSGFASGTQDEHAVERGMRAVTARIFAPGSRQATLWQAALNGLGRAAMSATLVSNLGWYPASWRRFPASQMPSYPDAGQLIAI